MKIMFTEARELLSGRIVAEGEKDDFGPEENAAFVQNGVAVWAEDEPDH
jgi:hypothetical protein